MARKSKPDSKESPPTPPIQPFHLRFRITVDIDHARQRFINRIHNLLFENYVDRIGGIRAEVYWNIANSLGEKYESVNDFDYVVGNDFFHCLQAIETAYKVMDTPGQRKAIESILSEIFSLSEIDLGIKWTNGVFRNSGSILLDEALINDPLDNLSDPKYSPIKEPFTKALSHFLKAERRPELYSDIITDCYEAVEASAKLVTGRSEKDLSANAENFIAKFPVSTSSRNMLKAQLKAYISYGNLYRHAAHSTEHRQTPNKQEAEAFLYESGLFIRLATAIETSPS